MLVEEIIGLIGMSFILLAFVMNQIHKWKDSDFIYDLVNVIGSLCLISYAFIIESFPFFILNSVWFLVSIRDVYLDYRYMEGHRSHHRYKKKGSK